MVERRRERRDTSRAPSETPKGLKEAMCMQMENMPSQKPASGSRDARAWRQWVAVVKAQPDSNASLAAVFEEMIDIWPESPEIWTEYISSESETSRKEALFKRCLPTVPDASVWQLYIEHVRSKPDADLPLVQQAFEYALGNVRHDASSGLLWKSYIDFLSKQLPAQTSWDAQHRTDELRKAYKRAVALPLLNIEPLWRAYDQFETQQSRATARKFVDERSGAYMLARSTMREYQNMGPAVTQPDTLPTWPANYASIVADWQRYLAFEHSNPLQLPEEEHHERLMWAGRRALVALRWSPQMWFECAELGGRDLLEAGLRANPTSFLIGLRLSELYETGRVRKKVDGSNGDQGIQSNNFAQAEAVLRSLVTSHHAANDNEGVTLAYVELAKLLNRARGIEGAREAAAECRRDLGDAASYQIWSTLATLEFFSGNADVATRVWQLGYRQFATEPTFALAYLRHLVRVGDDANGRVVFERSAAVFPPAALRPLFEIWMEHVAALGINLSESASLEAEFRRLYSGDNVSIFRQRYAQNGSDPIGRELTGETETNNDATAAMQRPQLSLPESVASLLETLPPASAYDGPDIVIPRLLNLVQQFA